jgi:DNA polymerase III alpha subunit (gram-positive type)
MTFVGKILVILIMAFSLVFLGVSTVVFSTANNWKTQSEVLTKKTQELKKSLDSAKAQLALAETQLKTAKDEHTKQLAEKQKVIDDKTKQATDAEALMAEDRSKLETALKNAQVSLDEATARKKEIDTVLETLAKAQQQANEFNAQNVELKDNIRVLERSKATAEQNNKDLRKFNMSAISYLRQKGIPIENIEKLDPDKVPPPVEGLVKELNATRRTMEITIGSDDGLAVGQELYVFRIQPRAEYIGKIKIVTVYPDKAVADVIGNTVNGKKVQEGDIVSSTFFNSR